MRARSALLAKRQGPWTVRGGCGLRLLVSHDGCERESRRRAVRETPLGLASTGSGAGRSVWRRRCPKDAGAGEDLGQSGVWVVGPGGQTGHQRRQPYVLVRLQLSAQLRARPRRRHPTGEHATHRSDCGGQPAVAPSGTPVQTRGPWRQAKAWRISGSQVPQPADSAKISASSREWATGQRQPMGYAVAEVRSQRVEDGGGVPWPRGPLIASRCWCERRSATTRANVSWSSTVSGTPCAAQLRRTSSCASCNVIASHAPVRSAGATVDRWRCCGAVVGLAIGRLSQSKCPVWAPCRRGRYSR